MKRSILMLMAMAVALIFFGCEKENFAPEMGLDDQETAALKAAKVKTTFTGTSTNVSGFPTGGIITNPGGKFKWMGSSATWYDEATDWRVKGKSVWYANYFYDGVLLQSTGTVWGKADLFVENPDVSDDPPVGKWEITWHGKQTLNSEGGFDLIVYAVGHGKEGVVKGLKAKWTYTLDWAAAIPTYNTVGSIQ